MLSCPVLTYKIKKLEKELDGDKKYFWKNLVKLFVKLMFKQN